MRSRLKRRDGDDGTYEGALACTWRLGLHGASWRTETFAEFRQRLDVEEMTANARLIAAAPDLLEACKAALYEVQDTEIHMLLDAAITKATAQGE